MIKLLQLVLLLLLPTQLLASLPFHELQFPRDEAAHNRNIPYDYDRLMEWWYVNGVATTDNHRQLSFDVALFNPALNSSSPMPRPFLHLQLSDLDNKKAYGAARAFSFNAGSISNGKLSIDIGRAFKLKKVSVKGQEYYQLKAHLKEDDDIDIDLLMKSSADFFLINGNGLMPMQNDTNSYYYSIPHMSVTGVITLNGEKFTITARPADAWMDHQWGDFDVSQNGWEWLSVRLENGLIANIFLIIDYQSNKVVDGLANIILPNGDKQFIPYQQFIVTRDKYWHDPETDINYPLSFDFNFPQLNLQFTSSASFAEQEVHGYWEGHTQVAGSFQGQPVKGFSYTELVYASPEEVY